MAHSTRFYQGLGEGLCFHRSDSHLQDKPLQQQTVSEGMLSLHLWRGVSDYASSKKYIGTFCRFVRELPVALEDGMAKAPLTTKNVATIVTSLFTLKLALARSAL